MPSPDHAFQSYQKNVSWLFGASCFSLGLGFAAQTLNARFLGPTGLGCFTLALYLPNMAALVLNLGLSSANIYFIGSGRTSVREAFSNALCVALVLSLGTIGIYLVSLSWLKAAFLKDVPQFLALLGIWWLPLSLLAAFASSILVAQELIPQVGLVRLLQTSAYLGLVGALVVGLKFGPTGAVISYMLSGLIGLVIILIFLSPGIKFIPSLHYPVLKEQVAFGLKGHIGNAVQFLNYRLDILFVTYFLGSREVGIYCLAVMIAEALWQVADAAQTALFPRIAATQGTAEFTLKVLGLVIGITFIGAVFLVILGKSLILLVFSDKFIEAYEAMLYLLPGIMGLIFAKILSADVFGRGYPWVGTLGAVPALLATLILNPLLIPILGVKGAALASSFSYIMAGVIVTVIFIRRCNLSYYAIISAFNPVGGLAYVVNVFSKNSGRIGYR
jgi:O-antigen/teichoic acid export membrane protein